MSYKIVYMGWNNTAGHDKVWGFVRLGDTLYVNFWGKRGKTLAFQEHKGYVEHEMLKKAREKARKGYTEIDIDKIDDIIPNFIDTFEHELTMARLFDSWR